MKFTNVSETDVRTLIASQQSLQLASCNAAGEAEISYAPFILLERIFYIFVSALAPHTSNMLQTAQASIMFIQAEADAADIFARQRLTFNCQVIEIDNEHTLYNKILDAMLERYGDIITILRALPDFYLLALTPNQAGRYVTGFGKTFKVDWE